MLSSSSAMTGAAVSERPSTGWRPRGTTLVGAGLMGPAASLARSSRMPDYVSADGELLYQAIRFEPKGFAQKRPDGAWKGPVPGTSVPYRLPELLQEDEAAVLIPGGEKDVDNLRALGFTATCNHGGEGKWWPELSQWFKGRRVFLLCDHDAAGEKHHAVVGAALNDIAADIRVVRFPELPKGGDVSDLIEVRRKAGLNDVAIHKEITERFEVRAELGQNPVAGD